MYNKLMITSHHLINHRSATNTPKDHLKVILTTITNPLVVSQADGAINLNTKNQLHNGTETLDLAIIYQNPSLVFQEDGVKNLKSKSSHLNMFHLMSSKLKTVEK